MDLQVECDFLFDMQDDVGVWLCCLDPSVVRQMVVLAGCWLEVVNRTKQHEVHISTVNSNSTFLCEQSWP